MTELEGNKLPTRGFLQWNPNIRIKGGEHGGKIERGDKASPKLKEIPNADIWEPHSSFPTRSPFPPLAEALVQGTCLPTRHFTQTLRSTKGVHTIQCLPTTTLQNVYISSGHRESHVISMGTCVYVRYQASLGMGRDGLDNAFYDEDYW